MLAKLHPEAEDELNEAVKYYETKSYGLGSRFWEAYQVLVDKLLKYPDLHPFAVDGIRWAKIEKFPYKVLYEIEGVDEGLAREAFALAAAKLPLQTTFVKRVIM